MSRKKHKKRSSTRASREALEAVRRAPLDPDVPVDPDAVGDVVDPDLVEAINDTQTLAEEEPTDRRVVGADPVDRKRAIVLAGDDVDAGPEEVESGEEAVGGSTPTPDQDRVDDLGRAVGVTYDDGEPLRLEEKEAERDDDRWELDPASAEDYQDRRRAAVARKKRRP